LLRKCMHVSVGSHCMVTDSISQFLGISQVAIQILFVITTTCLLASLLQCRTHRMP